MINLDHLIFCHFLFQIGEEEEKKEKEPEEIEVYLADSKEPLCFEVDPDEETCKGKGESGQFQSLTGLPQMGTKENEIFSFVDSDDETAFFRARDAAMIKVPLWVVEPSLEDEDENEDEGEAETCTGNKQLMS